MAYHPKAIKGALASAAMFGRLFGPQHDAHVQAYDREMDWRADQRLIGNGIEVIAECGTRMGGD